MLVPNLNKAQGPLMPIFLAKQSSLGDIEDFKIVSYLKIHFLK